MYKQNLEIREVWHGIFFVSGILDLQNKNSWKARISEAVTKKNEKELRKNMIGYSKLEDFNKEEYEVKEYLKTMKMNDARTFFRIRTKFKMNQSSDKMNRSSLWQCTGCGNVDTQSHIIWCPAYKDLREGKSLTSDSDLVEYYRKVLFIRETLDI